MSSMEIVKAGDLYRRSKILRRWKKARFVLYSSGDLKYFEDEDKFTPCETINLPVECKTVLLGAMCSVDPPSPHSKDHLLTIVTHEEEIYLSADSQDDALAWGYMLDQARLFRPQLTRSHAPPGYMQERASSAPPPYSNHPVFMSGSNQMPVQATRVVQHPDGSQTVYVGEQPYHYCHRSCHHSYGGYCDYCCRHDGSDMALGMAAGALLFTPFLWGPFMWF